MLIGQGIHRCFDATRAPKKTAALRSCGRSLKFRTGFLFHPTRGVVIRSLLRRRASTNWDGGKSCFWAITLPGMTRSGADHRGVHEKLRAAGAERDAGQAFGGG